MNMPVALDELVGGVRGWVGDLRCGCGRLGFDLPRHLHTEEARCICGISWMDIFWVI
jgi:hypothetical protein